MMTSNAEIIAGFEATIPEAEKGVIGCAKVVEMYSGNTGDTEILLHYANLMFFVSQVDLDIRVSLRNILADPAIRITTEKYLALALIEAERGAGMLLNRLRLAASKQHGRCAEFLDLRLFQEARDALEARLKPMRDDKPFMSDLTLIRNEVAAHLVSKGSGVEGSAKWALSRAALSDDEDAILRSKIVEYAIGLSLGIRELSSGLALATAAWKRRAGNG